MIDLAPDIIMHSPSLPSFLPLDLPRIEKGWITDPLNDNCFTFMKTEN